jgi:hypothetical protein
LQYVPWLSVIVMADTPTTKEPTRPQDHVLSGKMI